jgi:hypothetical protein
MDTREQQSAYYVRRCMRRVEAAGTDSCSLPKETIGHIQSAGCLGQKEVVTAAHNACIRELLKEVNVHGKANRHMKLLTIETERKLGTLWDQEQCMQFCSKDELWEAAKEEEMKIPWKEASEGQPVPEDQYQERFWRRRLDGIGLDTETKEFLAIEFKQTQDARSNYVEKATAVAQEQYTSLLTGLQAVGQVKGWKVQQIVFVGETCESVHVESFNKKGEREKRGRERGREEETRGVTPSGFNEVYLLHIMLFMLPKYPSFTPECEEGSIQEKKGACAITMWYKGYKVSLPKEARKRKNLQFALHAHACSLRCTLGAIRSRTRYAKWAGGSRSQTHRRAAMGGFTQDDGYVRGVAPPHGCSSGSFSNFCSFWRP